MSWVTAGHEIEREAGVCRTLRERVEMSLSAQDILRTRRDFVVCAGHCESV